MKKTKKIIAQTCDSRKCRKTHKDEIKKYKKISDTVTTCHIMDQDNGILTCMECGKKTKFET